MSSFRFLERPDEPRLAYRIDPPRSDARGRVLMVHGYAEHSGRYQRIVDMWTEHGLAVARFDLRGHGRSEGPRGHVAAFSDYVADLTAVLGVLEGDLDWRGTGKPMLFGHSLGGLISSHAALVLGRQLGGLSMTSPFFGLAKPIPFWQRALGGVAGRLTPMLRQPSGLAGSDCTHDPVIAREYDKDPLGFHHVTAGWFRATSHAQSELFGAAPRFTVPLFCIAAGDDRIASTPAIRRFFAVAGSADKELDVRPGLFHEVLNELDWREHASRLADRLLRWSMT